MPTYVAVFALVLAYLALVAAFCAMRTLARLRRATAVLGRGASGRETMLEAVERHVEVTTTLIGHVEQLQSELDAIQSDAMAGVSAGQARMDEQLEAMRADVAGSLRNVALIRFDAFEDMAGRMSFALALLDDRGDGVTVSALAGRSDTRVYTKGVRAGVGEHELTPEELDAVRAAIGRGKKGRRPGRIGPANARPESAIDADDMDEPEQHPLAG
jgi:hypothetical protein